MRRGIYSPRSLTDAARSVMGGIDLDPCSCLEANTTVQAERFYSEHENGLALPWHGNVYLNPPFKESKYWIEKLRREPLVRQVVIIGTLSNVAWHVWFEWIWDNTILMLARTPIYFWHPDRPKAKIAAGVIAYRGPNEQRFAEVFRDWGTILRRID